MLNAKEPVIVLFGASWSGHNIVVRTIVDKIGQDYQGRLKTAYVDIDELTENTKKYDMKSVPATVLFQSGEKTGLITGITSRENLLRLAGIQ